MSALQTHQATQIVLDLKEQRVFAKNGNSVEAEIDDSQSVYWVDRSRARLDNDAASQFLIEHYLFTDVMRHLSH